MTENPCEGCKENCCDGFYVRPGAIVELPKFIRVTYHDRFNLFCHCDNFDAAKGVCLDYENRPEICRRTGQDGNFPHPDCLLKGPADETIFDDFGGL